ncbi:PREDICTED: uncharacterized protein LOC105128794 isoform X2 [Populus euphratica]|uniref:Uncharacterized protein LOC105128794 isoform X2 n=1 Tax=Populus euphratica TaxID=75702 RepID=A0AAJ6UGH4_POPEU|nr:PREDICTED: uncharacterized protein LOC105128794 isoform X2 [Populus euphratica]
MENLVIIRSISKPPLTAQSKQESLSEFSQKPIKSSISFAKNPLPKFIDSHLDSLCKNGSLNDAVTVLDSVAQQGSKVTPRTYMNLLQSCIDTNSINLGRKFHARISVVQEKSTLIETKLVSMYAKCGYLTDARKVFDEMSERSLFTWSAMIGACCREKRWKEVVELYYMMMKDNVLPDGFLLPKILQAVGNCRDVKTGELLHSFVVRCGMGSSPRVNNSILAVYSKCGKLSLARRFFESMDERDIVAWNAMMSGYCLKGEVEEAHRLFDAMCEEGIEPGLVTWNILIAGYNQKGQCDVAMNLMKKMVSFGVSPDVVAWTAMISGLAQNNRNGQALDLYKEMILAGVEPNGVTITSALSACASLKVLNMGLGIHSLAVKMGFVNDVLVGNSLIDMYSKCGQLGAAQLVFDLMSEKDLYTWNSMIGGYCQAGYCGKAYVLFTKMQKSQVQPNVVTWNTMISGYIQSGDEDQAMDLFHRMEKEGEIKRDNASWNSLIAGFMQNRKKDKALGIFRQMQSFCISPNPVTVLSMLPACANFVALKKVKEIHGCVLRRNLVSVLSISNSLIDTYAKSGKIEYSRAIFDRIPSKDFITVNSMITGYVLHGCSDSALGLLDQMRELGLKPNRGTLVNIILAHSLAGMDGEKKPVAVGPWGGQEGFLWDDGVHSTVKQLVIAHGAGIDSIQVEYDRKGTSVWSQIHGGNGGMKTTVKLDCPDEFLTSVHGYYGSLDGWGPVFVRSLTFRSNKKTYGPFGVEQGTYFSLPMSGGKIVGFHGKSGWYLDAIGIYLKPLQKQKTSKALVQSKSYINNGTENISYTMMQGAANGFDIFVAVKQKDDFGKFSTQNSLEYSSGGTNRMDDFGSPLPSKLSRQISREFSDSESNKNDDFGSLLPRKLSTPISRELSDAGTNKTIATERVPSKTKGVIVHGPWGGVGGSKFDDGTYTGIRQIHLSRHVGIASIRDQYDRDGQAIWGSKHGKSGGFKSDKIIFDYPYEILTRVTGTYGPLMYMGPNIIKSLTFYTNKGKHGPFGEEQGPTFTNKIDEGKIIGFHGREGFLLDAIGLHVLEGTVKPAKHHLSDAIKQAEADVAEIENSPWSNKLVVARPGQTEEVVCGVIKEPAPCGPGPWGGDGGRPWDDGVFSGIKQIFITRAEAMCSIQIEYDRNGQSVWSTKHGGNGGTATHRVKLQCPHEVLVCLSGYYGPIGSDGNGPKVIKSLTFHTTRGNYGPFGEEIGTFFTSTATEGKVVGFHGRSSAYMDAIGVHMQHWLGNHRSSKPSSLFKIFS